MPPEKTTLSQMQLVTRINVMKGWRDVGVGKGKHGMYIRAIDLWRCPTWLQLHVHILRDRERGDALGHELVPCADVKEHELLERGTHASYTIPKERMCNWPSKILIVKEIL